MPARRLVAALLVLLAISPVVYPAAAGANVVRGQHYSAELISRSETMAANRPLTVAVVITPDKGWHVYWSNPGQTGYAPAMVWTLPAGMTASPLRHPAPQNRVLAGLASNVHEGETILLQELRGRLPGAVEVTADLDLLVCSDRSCVPDPRPLSLRLAPGAGLEDPYRFALFAKAEAALPKPLQAEASVKAGKDGLELFLPGLSLGNDQSAHVFSSQPQVFAEAAPQSFVAATGGLIARIRPGEAAIGASLPLVVTITGPDKTASYSVIAHPGSVPPAQSGAPGDMAGFLLALGGALLGGLLLNLMPCVFPILSLKALALARAGGNEREARAEAVGYALGAIGVILALGAGLMILRQGGHALGWAFQLQDSRVVAVLLLLVTAIATNMAGLFELPNLNAAGRPKSGFAGAVSTGALAAFIATPCTGPFMAGALGAALLLPPVAAMAIFFGLGLGLALPFLVLGFWSPARRWLPRPGAWMVTLRRALSLPMFATALGLAWILGRQSGVDGMALGLAASLLLGVALWWYGLRQYAGQRLWPVVFPAAAAVLLALNPGASRKAGAAAVAVEPGEMQAEPFSANRLAALRAQGKPVFLYLTADWCLSCKVNEATSLRSAAVARAFAAAGVTVMRGDWTNGDKSITQFLKEQGKAGVPVYFWFPVGGAMRELPQVLTPGLLVNLAPAHPA